jgi:hypothetical protein
MLAEDIIGPMIGIGADSYGHPINSRIPLFLGIYWDAGVADWLKGDDVISSYSSVYAFGAYLVRNYGGPALLRAMMDNSAVDRASITRALSTTSDLGLQATSDNVRSFEQALRGYAEALLYSTTNTGGVPNGKPSFDRSQSSVIGGKTYEAKAFDIWTMQMPPVLLNDKEFTDMIQIDSNYKGPVIIPYSKWKTQMPGYSIFIQQLPEELSGTWNTTLNIRPTYSIIDLKVVSY